MRFSKQATSAMRADGRRRRRLYRSGVQVAPPQLPGNKKTQGLEPCVFFFPYSYTLPGYSIFILALIPYQGIVYLF